MDNINLTDACRLRSNEFTRILAGCVAINPVKVLPMIEKLRPQSLTDIGARSFILAMRKKLPELIKADNDYQGTIFIEWATENHLLFDLALWMSEIKDSIADAENAIKQLKALAISLDTFERLQDWVKERQVYIYGR
jgi:hypothetical protein